MHFYICSIFFISFNTLIPKGTDKTKEQISAIIWVISTPVRPKKKGNIQIKGRKNNPCLEADTIDAFIALPID